MRRVAFVSLHGQSEVFVPLLNKTVQHGEPLEVSDEEADALFTNPNFVDADTGTNPGSAHGVSATQHHATVKNADGFFESKRAGKHHEDPLWYYTAIEKAGARYFDLWPHVRDAILDAHRIQGEKLLGAYKFADADDLEAWFTEHDLLKFGDLDELLAKREDKAAGAKELASRHLRSWLDDARGLYGGLFGKYLTFGFQPIATPQEVGALLTASDDELRARPPVVVLPEGVDFSNVHLAPSHFFAYAIVGEGHVKANDMPANVRAAFTELVGAIDTVKTQPASVGVQGTYVRGFYHKFAALFWKWHTEKPKTARQPGFFEGRESFDTSSTALAWRTHAALSSRLGWNTDAPYPYYDDAPSNLRFSIGDPDRDALDGPTLTLENIDLDPQMGIIHDAIIGKWLDARRNGWLRESGAVAIRVDEILELRGYKKHHKGGYRREHKLEIARRLQQLESVFVRGAYTDPRGKKHSLKGRLISLTVDSEHDLLGAAVPFAFLVKPGDATWPAYAAGDYLAEYFTAIARLDTSRPGVEHMAYLIGRYLVYQYRVRETKDFNQPYRVRTVIENARIEREANPSSFTRFREYFDGALDRLAKDAVLASWEYVAGDEERLPPRGWFNRWLDNRVLIVPPQSVRDRAAVRTQKQTERVAIASSKTKRARSPR